MKQRKKRIDYGVPRKYPDGKKIPNRIRKKILKNKTGNKR